VGNSIETGDIPGGGRESGRINAIAVDPSDPAGNTIYVTSQGGVWKTTNRGGSWTPLTDQQRSLATTAIVLDPTNTQNIYVATGDFFTDAHEFGGLSRTNATFFGTGILFSPNGGTTWTTIGETPLAGQAIFDMAFNLSGAQLYVAALRGFYIGSQSAGVWSFRQRGSGTFTSVRANPGNQDIVNLGAFGGPFVYRPSNDSLVRSQLCVSSTDCTTPIRAQPANVGQTIIAEDSAPTNARVVYASMECLTETGKCTRDPQNTPYAWWGVWESTDFGSTFHALVPPFLNAFEFDQAFFDLSLGVDASMIASSTSG